MHCATWADPRLRRRARARAVRRAPAPAEFLELVSLQGVPSGPGPTECLIELEGPRGKMRVQWKGVTAPDLAGLSRALWESA